MSAARAERATASITVQLPYEPPLDHRALLQVIAAHSVDGLVTCDVTGARHRKVIPAAHGNAIVELDHGGEGSITARLDLTDRDAADEIVATVRRWLDLDADPCAIDTALATDPRLAPLVARRPGLRVLGSTDPFETAVMTVVGQQVSLGAARTFGRRLLKAFGSPVADGLIAFPRPHVLAAAEPSELRATVGLTNARAATVGRLAELVASGLRIDAGAWGPDVEAELLAVPGIGRWTVDYLAVRASGDRDAFTPGDLVLRRVLGVRTSREATALADAWRPWRTYALMHLWTHGAYDAMPQPTAPAVTPGATPQDG